MRGEKTNGYAILDGTPMRQSETDKRFSGILNQFERLAAKPMAGDTKMGAFYTAAHNLAVDNPAFRGFLRSASEREMTPDHFANLFLRGVQYIEIHDKGRTEFDDAYKTPSSWEKVLVGPNGIISPDGEVTGNGEKLKEILATKETTTTKYQRYAGVKASLNALFPNQSVTVADFGCGANYGLPGLRGDLPLETVQIHTNNSNGTETGHREKRLLSLINTPVALHEGLSVDKNEPNGEEELKWRIACSFYPNELSKKNIDDVLELERKVAATDRKGLSFLKGDLLTLQTNHADGTLPEDKFDAVVMSTILYQMNPEEQTQMIKTAKNSLNPNGVIILQDFAEKDETQSTGLRIKGLSPEPYSYRTLVLGKEETEWQEFIQWSNGRCLAAKPGEDFDRVKSVTNYVSSH